VWQTALMADTIENRVYLFAPLAASFVERSAKQLASGKPEERARALRALADLAFVCCEVADSEARSPSDVHARISALAPAAPEKKKRA
jgi:hypothetical protein